jgi:hypothetical protein
LFLIVVALIAVIQVGMVILSPFAGIGAIFRLQPLTVLQWLGIAGITATIFPVAWIVRGFNRYLDK